MPNSKRLFRRDKNLIVLYNEKEYRVKVNGKLYKNCEIGENVHLYYSKEYDSFQDPSKEYESMLYAGIFFYILGIGLVFKIFK